MHRTVRMLAILLELQRGPTTIGQLAGMFECSRKTIQRDIAALVELHLPISSSPGAHGGVAIDPSWMLGPLNLTSDEIETLILALEASPHLPAVAATLAKIRAASTPSRFDAVANNPLLPTTFRNPAATMPPGIERVRNIVRRDLWCRIDYDGGTVPGWRVVKPVELRITEGRWYLYAIDEGSKEHRFFRIDRVKDLVPTLAPATADAIITSAQSQPSYRSEQHPMVKVLLTPGGKRFCQDHTDFHDFLVGDQLQFRCPPREYRYYARELLRIGTECTVISPPELIAEMQSLTAELSKHLHVNVADTVS